MTLASEGTIVTMSMRCFAMSCSAASTSRLSEATMIVLPNASGSSSSGIEASKENRVR